MDIVADILAIGFIESYKLWDSEGENIEGSAYTKNGMTICIKGSDITMLDRYEGKFLINEQISETTLKNIKLKLNQSAFAKRQRVFA